MLFTLTKFVATFIHLLFGWKDNEMIVYASFNDKLHKSSGENIKGQKFIS